MIAIEKRLQVTAQTMADRKWTAVDRDWTKSESDKMGLSEEQQNAAFAATDQNAISVIEGAAGSGKPKRRLIHINAAAYALVHLSKRL